MNRNAELQALLLELEQTPEILDTSVDRAIWRSRAVKRRRKILGIPAGTMAACFLTFVLLVNLVPTFAYACGGVPLLRELAKAVALSPSLSAAVENEYVQPIGLSQTKNGITAAVEYVIVDQKQVNIFFTLNGEGYESLSAELPEFTPRQDCSVLGAGFRQPPGTLLDVTMDYGDQDVPEGFTMTFAVTGEREGASEASSPAAPERAYEDEMLSPEPETDEEILAEFTFELTFDPQFTAKGEILSVDQTFVMDGQTFTVTQAEVYPTHVRINVEGAETNTAWLKGLDFYLENEDGRRFESISNGVTASGDPETPAMVSYRLESPYFSHSDHLTLHITGAEWLEKEHQRVYVDLVHETAPWLPEGVTLASAQLRQDGWFLRFRLDAALRGSPFSMTFYDADGAAHEMGQMGMSVSGDDEDGELMLPLPGYREGEVWLEAHFSHHTQLSAPVAIPIK